MRGVQEYICEDVYEWCVNNGIALKSKWAEIYSLEIKPEGRTRYLWINGDTGYPLIQWTIPEAIADYLTEESYLKRMDFHYRAWGYYD